MEKVLILGGSGLVGKAAIKELRSTYEVYGTYHKSNFQYDKLIHFDITKVNMINDILDTVKPVKIIYAMRGDYELQLVLLKKVIDYLKVINGKLCFCSTANVFDGDVTKAHMRSDRPVAESEYGIFKIKCEELILNGLSQNYAILRLPMIWGSDSQRLNELKTALKSKEDVHVYTNLYLNNNTDTILAKQINYILRHDLKGIFHVGSNELINHYDFIKSIISKLHYENPEFNEETLEEKEYFLAVLPSDEGFPEELTFTNEDVINDMLNNIFEG